MKHANLYDVVFIRG